MREVRTMSLSERSKEKSVDSQKKKNNNKLEITPYRHLQTH